jgi:hypothetical protein
MEVDTRGAELRRRSPRIVAVIPVSLMGVAGLTGAHTAVINRHGALVLSPLAFPAQAGLQVTNEQTGESQACRVVWAAGLSEDGLYRIGIELDDPEGDFWGRAYSPDAREGE